VEEFPYDTFEKEIRALPTGRQIRRMELRREK